MSKKRPAIMFYTGDWVKDPALGMCSPATRGIWIDMLCFMHENKHSGVLSGTVDSLARVCRCTPAEMEIAIEELRDSGTADVTECNADVTKCNKNVTACNKKVTLCNRRMAREHKDNEASRLRVKRYREKRKCNADVTPPSSYSVSSSVSTTKETIKESVKEKSITPTVEAISCESVSDNNGQSKQKQEAQTVLELECESITGKLSSRMQTTLFEDFWPQYPRRKKKPDALRIFKSSVKTEEDWVNIKVALSNYLKSSEYMSGKVQKITNWLKGWRDWLEEDEYEKAMRTGDTSQLTMSAKLEEAKNATYRMPDGTEVKGVSNGKV